MESLSKDFSSSLHLKLRYHCGIPLDDSSMIKVNSIMEIIRLLDM